MAEWEPRTVSVSQRLRDLHEEEDARETERRKIYDEWPTLENREKGEALQRLFNTVTLYWDATWHPNQENPTRPRRTDRKGRNSFELLVDKIKWDLAGSILAGSW